VDSFSSLLANNKTSTPALLHYENMQALNDDEGFQWACGHAFLIELIVVIVLIFMVLS
jgi:hypothetical protein